MSPLPPAGDRPAGRVPLHGNVWLWAFLIGIATITLMRPLLRREPAPPPVLGRLPAFELTAPEGRRFGPEALQERVWVLGFFSVSDEAPRCQGLVESMEALERRYDEAGIRGVGLLGLSSDPARDSPESLREFAEARGLDAGRWRLATGEPGEVRRLAA